MILGINTNGKNNCLGIYQKSKTSKEKYWKVNKDKRKDVLLEIDKFITDTYEVSVSDLKAIAVYQGSGSFTSLRVGITIANTFAWSLNIPVIGIKGNKYNQNLSALEIIKKADKIINKKKSTKFAKPVEPYYGTILN